MTRRARTAAALAAAALAAMLLPGTAHAIRFDRIGPFATNCDCMASKTWTEEQGTYLVVPQGGTTCPQEADGYYYHSAWLDS
ncbi:hypothetical protein [Actinokineospora globicatena]|uniref:hypothetical protein n=1 Tax=Actinokineospora globicatena TaxID=103729 RepID=UPI0020A5E649|nr:hypothetical protein [Actinokineospora globicatena]MCP2303066.1 hypothetical protein [Actinokineospora globicatena]GLW79821.1 hypothetical protein Aglo01_43020 [Actinokineospora globicatena]GLW85769.1 hypothetical protein Aglo02_34090 [Actinokineospora globicatena]